jgi:hypothetical protein
MIINRFQFVDVSSQSSIHSQYKAYEDCSAAVFAALDNRLITKKAMLMPLKQA